MSCGKVMKLLGTTGTDVMPGHGLKACDCGGGQTVGWKQSGGKKKGQQREKCWGRRARVKRGLTRGSHKK